MNIDKINHKENSAKSASLFAKLVKKMSYSSNIVRTKWLKLGLLIFVVSMFIFPLGVSAQVSFQPEVDGLQAIELPTFLSLDEVANFSIFSYIALAISLIFVGVSIFWIALVIRAGVTVIQSQGADGVQEGYKQLGSVFWSVGFLFGFFVVLILVASFFGLGNFLAWPKYLSICEDGGFYVTKVLESPNASEEQLDNICFETSAV